MRYSSIIPTTGLTPLYWSHAAPTWNNLFPRPTLQGQVGNPNAYAMGGVSGHAGLFSTAMDTFRLMRGLMFPKEDTKFVNATTFNHFTTIHDPLQSPRALGWDTNNYLVRDYSGCGNFSSNSFMHSGYTGTQVCGDKDRHLFAILLSNSDALPTALEAAQKSFSDAVIAAYDSANAAAEP